MQVESVPVIDITKIIGLAIMLIGAIITGFLIPYVRAKTKKEKEDGEMITFENIKAWVMVAVKSAEMIFTTPGAGAEKLQYAMEYMNSFLASKGISMDGQQIRMLIESAVLELKQSLL